MLEFGPFPVLQMIKSYTEQHNKYNYPHCLSSLVIIKQEFDAGPKHYRLIHSKFHQQSLQVASISSRLSRVVYISRPPSRAAPLLTWKLFWNSCGPAVPAFLSSVSTPASTCSLTEEYCHSLNSVALILVNALKDAQVIALMATVNSIHILHSHTSINPVRWDLRDYFLIIRTTCYCCL